MAFKVFRHAFLMVWNNLGVAARVSILPVVLLITSAVFLMAFGFALFEVFGGRSDLGSGGARSGLPRFVWGLGGAFFAICLVAVFSWIAVAWHRFVLLGEEPKGWLPAWSRDQIVSYGWRLSILIILSLVLSLPSAWAPNGALIGGVLQFLAAVIFGWIGFRFSMALPAAALGEASGFGQSWRDTLPYAAMIFGVSAFYAALSVGVDLLTVAISPVPWFGDVVLILSGWFMSMLGISLVTTLFGVIVQNRSVQT